MNPRIAHLRSIGCEVNYYIEDEDHWTDEPERDAAGVTVKTRCRIEISTGKTGEATYRATGAVQRPDDPSYWIVSATAHTREDAERAVLMRFDQLGFFPTAERELPGDERVLPHPDMALIDD